MLLVELVLFFNTNYNDADWCIKIHTPTVMGKTPGKWIKTLFRGKKSSKSDFKGRDILVINFHLNFCLLIRSAYFFFSSPMSMRNRILLRKEWGITWPECSAEVCFCIHAIRQCLCPV